MAAKKKLVSIQKAEVNVPATLDVGSTLVVSAFTTFSNSLSNVAKADIPKALSLVLDFSKVTKSLEESIKKKVKALVMEEGAEVEGTKGSRSLVIGDKVLTLRPQASGYDPKKIEALLRAKGMSPQGIMEQEVKYVMGEDTIQKMAGRTTPAELEACKYEAKYSVLRPKTVGEVTDGED